MSKKSEQKVARVLYMIVLSVAFLILVSPFAIPVIFAASVSLALFPLVLMLEKKGLSRKMAAAILTILFTILISIPISFFLAKGTMAVTSQLEKINFNEALRDQGMQGFVSDARHDLVLFVHKHAAKLNLEDFLTPKKVDGYLNMVTTFLLKFFQSVVASLPVVFLFLLVMVLCTYSLLKNAHTVRMFFQKIFGFSDEIMNDLVAITIRDARSVYVSNIATGGIQSLIVAIAATILGIGSFFLIFFVTLILSFIPVIGAAPVAFALAGLSYFKGETTHAIILLVVGCFTGVVDNILRPWLASIGESKIPPMTAFICVLGGALLLGFPGLFIGLLVGAFAYDTLPIFWREIGRGDNSYVEESSHET
ncbi:MAG: AI-2E family transporter [Bdellovibrionota bacterium]